MKIHLTFYNLERELVCIIKEYRKLHLKYPVQVVDAFKDGDEFFFNIF